MYSVLLLDINCDRSVCNNTLCFICIDFYVQLHSYNDTYKRPKIIISLVHFLWFHSKFMTTFSFQTIQRFFFQDLNTRTACIKIFKTIFFFCSIWIEYIHILDRNTCTYVLYCATRHRLINLFECNFLCCLRSF